MNFNIRTYCFLGLPIPIVAISAGIAHEQYGINDRWVGNLQQYTVTCVTST